MLDWLANGCSINKLVFNVLIKFINVTVVLYILVVDQSTKNQAWALSGLGEWGLANYTFNMNTLNHIKFLVTNYAQI
jgi:hypothetical protein